MENTKKKKSMRPKRRFFSTRQFYKHPRTMLIVILLITLFFALQLPRLRLDNNNFRFIPKNDPARITTEKIASVFGDESPVLIGVEREFSTIIDKNFLNELRKLSTDLTEIELVKSAVSIVNTKHIEAGVDGTVSANLLIPENFDGTPEAVAEIKRKIRDWDFYTGSLVSGDLKSVQILVFLNVSNEKSGEAPAAEACRKIIALLDDWKFPDSKTYITGMPVFSQVVNEATSHDLRFLIPLVIAVVICVLFLSFRRFSGVFLPLLTVIASVIWAIGAMGLFGVPLSILSTVLPVILIAVGSAYGIHVINHYYDEVVQNDSISKEEHKNQVMAALHEVIRPVSLAALTTFAGFVSFCFTSVAPIFEFGIFSSFGILSAFLISITLIPSILILRGPKKPLVRGMFSKKSDNSDKLDESIANTFVVIAEHKRSVVIAAVICVVVSVFGVKKLVIDNVLMEYFQPDVSVVKSDLFIRENFGGSKLLNVIIESEEPGRVIAPDVLKAMDELSVYLTEEVPEAGKVSSIADLIKRMNQVYNADEPPEGLPFLTQTGTAGNEGRKPAEEDGFGFFEEEETSGAETEPAESYLKQDKTMRLYTQAEVLNFINEAVCGRKNQSMSADELINAFNKKINFNGKAYYEIPFEPRKYGKTGTEELKALVYNYLVLLAGNTEGLIDNVFSPKSLKMNIQLKTLGQHDSGKVLDTINGFIKEKFPEDVKVVAGGPVLVEKSLNNLVVQSQLISVAVSLLIVFLILSFYYRSLIAGIIGIIPLSISILMNFAFMGFTKIKLNIGTAMVASFAIGIGVDYTIHYLAAYHKAVMHKVKEDELLFHTFLGSGKAILFNAASVGAGFAVLMLSEFNMLAELGFLISLVMATSSLGSLTILSTLLTIMKPKFIYKVLPVDTEEQMPDKF